MTQQPSRSCPACGAARYEVFAELPGMPVHVGVLWDSAEAARGVTRGDIDLAHCRGCGFVGNVAFDAGRVDYGLRYDNALHFSPTFRAYERETAERLIESHGIRGRRIAEIGCGSGHFLSLICSLGDNQGIGFDPSHEPDEAGLGPGVRVLREHYSEHHAEHRSDLMCCRHVLEHIPEPRGFLDMVRRSLDGDADAVVYFEVPNAFLVFRELSIWDVIYEHCNYFSGATLETLFRTCGFEVLDLRESYQGQFVSVEARLAPEPKPGEAATVRDAEQLAVLQQLVAAFADEVREKRARWTERCEAFEEAGSRVVIWGGGAKTVTFLNLIRSQASIRAVVDINPGKQGSFIAGTGQPVVPPASLKEIDPDVVVVMNVVYRDEIAAQLDEIGLHPEILVV